MAGPARRRPRHDDTTIGSPRSRIEDRQAVAGSMAMCTRARARRNTHSLTQPSAGSLTGTERGVKRCGPHDHEARPLSSPPLFCVMGPCVFARAQLPARVHGPALGQPFSQSRSRWYRHRRFAGTTSRRLTSAPPPWQRWRRRAVPLASPPRALGALTNCTSGSTFPFRRFGRGGGGAKGVEGLRIPLAQAN
jgi:hypothetical protein